MDQLLILVVFYELSFEILVILSFNLTASYLISSLLILYYLLKIRADIYELEVDKEMVNKVVMGDIINKLKNWSMYISIYALILI